MSASPTLPGRTMPEDASPELVALFWARYAIERGAAAVEQALEWNRNGHRINGTGRLELDEREAKALSKDAETAEMAWCHRFSEDGGCLDDVTGHLVDRAIDHGHFEDWGCFPDDWPDMNRTVALRRHDAMRRP